MGMDSHRARCASLSSATRAAARHFAPALDRRKQGVSGGLRAERGALEIDLRCLDSDRALSGFLGFRAWGVLPPSPLSACGSLQIYKIHTPCCFYTSHCGYLNFLLYIIYIKIITSPAPHSVKITGGADFAISSRTAIDGGRGEGGPNPGIRANVDNCGAFRRHDYRDFGKMP